MTPCRVFFSHICGPTDAEVAITTSPGLIPTLHAFDFGSTVSTTTVCGLVCLSLTPSGLCTEIWKTVPSTRAVSMGFEDSRKVLFQARVSLLKARVSLHGWGKFSPSFPFPLLSLESASLASLSSSGCPRTLDMLKPIKRLFKGEGLPNPGKVDDLKREAQAVLAVDAFDGARFDFNKPLSNQFALTHNVFLGSSQIPPSYEFGANFGDERLLLASRIDMAGRLNGRVNWQATDSLCAKVQAQLLPDNPQNNSTKIDLDYKGRSFYAGATYMGGGLFGAHYMQSVTPALALGVEGIYHPQRQIHGGAAAARCVWGPGGEHVATAKAGSFGNVELSYHRKVSEKVGLATELNYHHNKFCTFGLGYEFRLRQATVKGAVMSDTTCTAVIEERVAPGVNLTLSGQLNHKQQDYKFGFGLSLGAQ